MNSIPYSELRAHLAETLRQLEVSEEALLISRRGEPAAVLMSMARYQRLQGGPGGFAPALLAWRERHAADLAADGSGNWQDPFADVRDRSVDGGRPAIDWPDILSAPAEVSATKHRATPRPRPKTRGGARK